MRNVLIGGCILSILLFGFSQLGPVSAQNHGYNLWSDQQITSEEWQPFVPPNYEQHNRPIPSFPHTDSVRQYFGKPTLEPVQNLALKKSLQTSTIGNNIDQYSIPSISSSFGSFGVQELQSRNPVFDKNIKDSHLLEQPSHFLLNYQTSQQRPQVSTSVHRFPAFSPSGTIEYYQRQPLPPQQPQSSFHGNAPNTYLTRPSSMLQAAPPRNPITTSIQVFPPPPPLSSLHNQQFSNSYFAGVSHLDKYNEKEDPPHDRKNIRNNVNIYNTRQEASSLPLSPPVTQKPNPYGQRQENNFYFDNVKAPPDRYEYVVSDLHRAVSQHPLPSYPSVYNNEHIRGTNGGSGLNLKLNLDSHNMAKDTSPSKEVYEQLSYLGRPFTLPKESEPESLSSHRSIPHQSQPSLTYKNTKPKQQTTPSTAYHRLPGSLTSLIDYETGNLQSVKTVTYQPAQDLIQFNEGDVSSHNAVQSTSEKSLSKPFLSTPINENEDVDIPMEVITFAYHNQHPPRITTVPDNISRLPYNHKYNSTRNRQPESVPHLVSYESKLHSDLTETKNTDEDVTTTSTTRKPSLRRRKPTKTKSKIPTSRYKSTTEQDVDYSSTVTHEPDVTQGSYYYKTRLSHYGNNDYSNEHQLQDSSAVADTQPPTTTATASVNKRKQKFKSTTTSETSYDDDHPNYPIEYNFQNKQYNNYPSGEIQHNQGTEQNIELEDTKEVNKANYPILREKLKPSTTTETTAPLPTSSATSKMRKSKFTTPATTAGSNSSNAVTRPRFSIKDYKRTTISVTPTQQQTTPFADTTNDTIAEAEKKKKRKQVFAVRSRNRTEQATTDSGGPVIDNNDNKYKPRIRPSRLKISALTPTTAFAVVDTTSERVNTFKPLNGNRLKTSTSKYYNRFRTTSELENNAGIFETESAKRHDDEDVATSFSNNKPTRIALNTAKKSSIGSTKDASKVKIPEYEDDEEDDYEDGDNNEYVVLNYTDEDEKTSKIKPHIKSAKNKKVTYKPLNHQSKIEKADDVLETRIMTSSEEEIIKGNFSTDMKRIGGDDFSAYSVEESPNDEDSVVVEEPKSNSSNSLQSVLITPTATVKPRTVPSPVATIPTPVTVSTLVENKDDAVFEDYTQNRQDQQDYQDDVNDRVSKISSLTSQDELNHVHRAINTGSHHKQWQFPLYSSRIMTTIKTTSDY